MEFNEALKKVQTNKTKENLIAIRLTYDCTVILPWKDGMLFMNALERAEMLTDNYNDQPRIVPFEHKSVQITVFPTQTYERIKIAALLGVKPDEVKQYEEGAIKEQE